MALQLIYLMFSKLLGWIMLHTRSDTAKEIEILVLRLWVPRTVSRLLTSAFVVAQAPRLPAIADQHDRSLWPSDSPTSCSDAC